ncbi:MAG: aromatic-ring-hydroxylating dioxygenase subunit beta [Solirubrobacteraceae bacterium]
MTNPSVLPGSGLTEAMALRLAVEEFLTEEAAMLDEWELDRWVVLFADPCRFVVPSTDTPNADPRTDLTLIDDDYLRLTWRVKRLKSRHAHREFPYSRTRRLVTNVRLTDVRDDEVDVSATALVYRFRHGHQDTFVARYRHTLLRTDEGFLFRIRRAELDMERLSPNGAISMIL